MTTSAPNWFALTEGQRDRISKAAGAYSKPSGAGPEEIASEMFYVVMEATGLASTGLLSIAAERQRQVEVEGWTPEHDDEHQPGTLCRAAACYAFNAYHDAHLRRDGTPHGWPWEAGWWKPYNRRADLVRAGALIAAEVDRIDRTEVSAGE